MDTFQMTPHSQVKLSTTISSDALAGSNVSLNGKVIKKSTTYEFITELGDSDSLANAVASMVSNFFVHGGNIDIIMNQTTVTYACKDDGNAQTYEASLVKINDHLFMAYGVIQLVTA